MSSAMIQSRRDARYRAREALMISLERAFRAGNDINQVVREFWSSRSSALDYGMSAVVRNQISLDLGDDGAPHRSASEERRAAHLGKAIRILLSGTGVTTERDGEQ